MRKSSRASRNAGLGGRSTGLITVIDARVHWSSARNAKLAFWLTGIVTTLLAAPVLADRMHPILAVFVGVALGAIIGAVVWALVRAWPVIRLLWWWTLEIGLALAVMYGFTFLARHTTLPARLAVVVLVVGVPAAIPWTQRRIRAVAWCVIVRHRLRVCFRQFIIANQSGSLPLILLARPTPVGERVWIYLRPGLSLADLQTRAEKLAVACHGKQVTAELAGKQTNAAYVRIDVKRREVLDVDVENPLVDLVDPNTPARVRNLGMVPTALDLPDVTDPATNNGTNGSAKPATSEKLSARKPSPTVIPAPVAVSADGEDVSDFV